VTERRGRAYELLDEGAARERGPVIEDAMKKLEKKHNEHIKVYGAHNEERLTGLHETSAIHEFRHGQFDRGASVRIPMVTVNAGKGYFEDRRPAANMDPYQVCAALIETVCGS
jgi:glutamine synthetase